MEAKQIINGLAKERFVEKMVSNIAHRDLDTDLQDLCQMVYVTLLEKEPSKIEGLAARNEMRFYISKIITNLLRSKTSRYYYEIKKPRISETAITPFLAETRPED